MQKVAMVVHGGAGADSDYIKDNKFGYEEGLKIALLTVIKEKIKI